ncbi:MAG: SEC-C metal-binding domain-containing protein [Acidobacteriota bacterium]
MKTGRNSPCTCGSGMKYKECCGPKEGKGSRMLAIVGLVIVGAVILAWAIFVSKDSNQQPATAGAPADPSAAGSAQPAAVPGSPQPPGPAPAGKVWNAEHGHWHDAPGAPAAGGATIQPGAAQPGAAQPGSLPPGSPQPPGPAPAGKVWSAEHGHWHDAPAK